MGVNSLPKTVIRQRPGCDWNPGPTAPDHLATEPPVVVDGVRFVKQTACR